MSTEIEVVDRDNIRTIAIGRKGVSTALSEAALIDMAGAFDSGQYHVDTRCLLIVGRGTDFLVEGTATSVTIPNAGEYALLHALLRNQKPLVVALDGAARGIGATLLLHADHVLATERATISLPFESRGGIPSGAATLLAPRLLSHQQAFELLVLRRPLTGTAAHAAGLVNRLTRPEELADAARSVAAEITRLPPLATKLTKRLLRLSEDEVFSRLGLEAEYDRLALAQ